MKAYIAGKITGNPDYKDQFNAAQQKIESAGHIVMNPSLLPKGFEQEEYLHVCKAMIDVCRVVYFLPNWKTSYGANYEMGYAIGAGKTVRFLEEEQL